MSESWTHSFFFFIWLCLITHTHTIQALHIFENSRWTSLSVLFHQPLCNTMTVDASLLPSKLTHCISLQGRIANWTTPRREPLNLLCCNVHSLLAFPFFFFKLLIYIIRLLKKAEHAQRMHDVHSPACVVFWGCILSLRPVSLACTPQALSENRRSSWDIMPPMNILKNRSLYSLQGFFSLFFRSAVICSTHCYPSPEAILKMDVLEKAAPHLCTRVWRGKVAAILFHLCKNYCKLREKNLKNVSHYLKGQHVFRWMSLCWI